MANKFFKNLGKAVSNAIPSNKPATPADQKQKAKEDITASFHNEQVMLAKLNKIDLEHPQNKLSAKKMQELNVGGVIKYAASQLRYPLISEANLRNLDSSMTYIIDALEQSVKSGLEKTAEWACTALVFAVKNLRIEVAGIDKEYEDKVWEARVQYVQNLELLVKSCIEYDRQSNTIAEQKERRQRKREEQDQRKQHYLARKNSGELDEAIADMVRNANTPAKLSDAGVALKEELTKISQLGDDIVQIDGTLNAAQAKLSNAEADIETRRNILSVAPDVTDPTLRSKIEESNRRYRENLRQDLNLAEEALRAQQAHISTMIDLANHSLHKKRLADALKTQNDLAMEELENQMIAQEAARIRANNAANSQLIQDTIKVEEPIVDIITEPEQELEQEFVFDI